MAKSNLIVSRKGSMLMISLALFIFGFLVIKINVPDDIDITSGFATANAAATPASTKQEEQPTIAEPITTAPPLPPIDLIALRMGRTEELARLDYEAMKATREYIRETPTLPPTITEPTRQPRTFETTCYDPRYGYFICIVTE